MVYGQFRGSTLLLKVRYKFRSISKGNNRNVSISELGGNLEQHESFNQSLRLPLWKTK
jgi:hypothetical protein